MKILITGASGFIGKRFIFEHSNRFSIETVGRHSAISNFKHNFISNIDSNTNWRKSLKGKEGVLHLAGLAHNKDKEEFYEVNTRGTINLATQAAEANVRRFVYVSSIGVSAGSRESILNEQSECIPNNDYAISKFKAEKSLRKIAQQSKMEVTIVRPPLVYGYGAKGNFETLLKLVKLFRILPFGSIKNKRSFIHVDNLCDILKLCIEEKKAANETFVVADGVDISTTDFINLIALGLNIKVWNIPIPVPIMRFLAEVLRQPKLSTQLFDSLQVDITKARQVLNWKPRKSIGDAMQELQQG